MLDLLKRILARRATWLILFLILAAIAGLWLWTPRKPAHAPPLEFRTGLVKQLSAETVEETLRIMPDFQDFGWVLGSFPDGPGRHGSYKFCRQLVPRMNRVRKLLELGRRSPEQFVPPLARMLDENAQGLKAARKANLAQHPDGTVRVPTDYYRKIVIAPAAAYILADLKAHSSLPLMAKVYRRPEAELPLSKVFLWYSMHLLALDHPREGLSDEAKRALDSYLELTRATVPAPQEVEVTAWDTALEETDARVVMGKADIGLKTQRKIRIRMYPAEFIREVDYHLHVPEKFQGWFNQLAKFVDLAYPPG